MSNFERHSQCATVKVDRARTEGDAVGVSQMFAKQRAALIALVAFVAGIACVPQSWAQVPQAASSSASSASSSTNKAGKPPTDAAASISGVATKKPAKAGAQSGPASAPAAK